MQRLADDPPAGDAAPPGSAGADPASRAGGRDRRHLPARLPAKRRGRVPDRVRGFDDVLEPHLGGGCGPGGDAVDRSHHRLDLPGRRQRRPQYAGAGDGSGPRGLRHQAAQHRPRPGLVPAAGRGGGHSRLALEPSGNRLPTALRRRQDGDHPGRRLHASRSVAFPLAGVLAGGRARSRSRHRLAGPLDRPERHGRQPAPGDLGRLVAGRLAEERDQPGRGAFER